MSNLVKANNDRDGLTEYPISIHSEHHELHEGNHFYVSGFETVASAANVDFTVQTPDSNVHGHLLFAIEGTSQTEFRIYEGSSDDNDGTTTTPINNNRNSTNASIMTVQKNPNNVVLGTLIFSQSKGLAGTTPQRSDNEGVVERHNEIILKKNTKYLFRITSRDDGNIVSYVGEWYEQLDKEA